MHTGREVWCQPLAPTSHLLSCAAHHDSVVIGQARKRPEQELQALAVVLVAHKDGHPHTLRYA
ncbi:hypothetical protein BJF81_14625 [Ornithinimicrobium sp. CNJ-824]|nr:hypothetical protein BJF81_14625 [Ornithinimicrobium sp. CNJ-824]